MESELPTIHVLLWNFFSEKFRDRGDPVIARTGGQAACGTRRNLVLSAVLIISCMEAAVRADEIDTSPVFGDGVSEVLSNLIQARSLLHSGEFRAIGKRIDDEKSNDPCLSELFCALDTRSDCFRFDTRGERHVSVLPANSLTPDVGKQVQERTRRKTVSIISRNPEYSVEWIAIGESAKEKNHARLNLQLRDPDAPPSADLSSAFNARALGLIEFDRIHLKDMTLEAIFKQFAHYSSYMRTTIELTHEKEDKIQVTYTTGMKYRRVITIDPSRGFTVTNMRLFELDEMGREVKHRSIESTVSWEFKNNVWVPTHFSAMTIRSEDAKTGYDYDLDWLSVNPDSLDSKLFDYKHFEGIWKDTHVFDRRNGQAKYIETIGGINLKEAP